MLALAFVLLAAQSDPARVLLIDGQNNHNWAAMTPFMKAQLEKTGMFKVDVSTSPPKAAKNETPEQKAQREKAWAAWRPAFDGAKVVLLNYNGEMWPDEVKSAFLKHVEAGGGVLVIHAANNAFEGWPEYNDMIGLGWRGAKFGPRLTIDGAGKPVLTPAGEGPGAGHGPQHEFKVRMLDLEHPITKGFPAEWMHAKDELYHGQRGPAKNMQVLASAWSAKEKGGTGAHEPMLWVIPYGKGRVVTNVMGHENGQSLQCVGFVALLGRSCEWLATGAVTLPLPAEFPTAEQSKTVPK